jgi:signal peptidase I
LGIYDNHAGGIPQPASRGLAASDTSDSALPAQPLADPTVARARVARQQQVQNKALVWEIAQTVLLTIAIFLAVRLVIQNFRVEGASMDPTLHSGQFLLVDKVSYLSLDSTPLENIVQPKSVRSSLHYAFSGPSRGDIIVFRSPQSPDKDFIKRVIGLPGETVKIDDGRVYVNGVRLDEPYVTHKANYDLEAKRIPGDAYFVLGDNRPNSSDSHLGWFVKADTIVGRAWVSYWPPNLWGVVQAAAYANLDDR